jgi:hypothetical protein
VQLAAFRDRLVAILKGVEEMELSNIKHSGEWEQFKRESLFYQYEKQSSAQKPTIEALFMSKAKLRHMLDIVQQLR